jgi:hypothetical protein
LEAGAVAEALLAMALAAMASFDAEFADAIAALASDEAAAAELSAVFVPLLQAATDTAAMAAPTIRMERSVPEGIVPGPKWKDGCSVDRDAVPQYDEFAIQGKREFTVA